MAAAAADNSSAGGAPAGCRPEAGLLQRRPQWRGQHGLTVSPLDGELAEHAVADRERERVGRGLHTVGVVAPRQQRLAATLDVEREVTVDEDDERACFAAGS